jgi:hypothetical protein
MNQTTIVSYAGKWTNLHLWEIEQGHETLATLKREKTVWRRTSNGDLLLSYQEAIVLLEQSQDVSKTQRELIAEMQEYQMCLERVKREPDAYLAPDKARAWYEQQITRIRKLLVEGA